MFQFFFFFALRQMSFHLALLLSGATGRIEVSKQTKICDIVIERPVKEMQFEMFIQIQAKVYCVPTFF